MQCPTSVCLALPLSVTDNPAFLCMMWDGGQRTRWTVKKTTAVCATPTERSMDTKPAGSPVALSLMKTAMPGTRLMDRPADSHVLSALLGDPLQGRPTHPPDLPIIQHDLNAAHSLYLAPDSERTCTSAQAAEGSPAVWRSSGAAAGLNNPNAVSRGATWRWRAGGSRAAGPPQGAQSRPGCGAAAAGRPSARWRSGTAPLLRWPVGTSLPPGPALTLSIHCCLSDAVQAASLTDLTDTDSVLKKSGLLWQLPFSTVWSLLTVNSKRLLELLWWLRSRGMAMSYLVQHCWQEHPFHGDEQAQQCWYGQPVPLPHNEHDNAD